MEWLLGGPQLQNTGSQLGMQVGNTYRVQDTCLETLVELLAKLSAEDRTLRTFRRALGFSQIIQKDLVPLLIHEKNDVRIIDACIRLLVNLTIPVECLLPMEIMARTDAGRHTIYELNNLLFSAKDAFVEPRSTKSILDFMRKIIDREEKLSLEQCDGINNCLLLVRNILHIPEQWPMGSPTNTPCSKQNLILWNLFAQGIDKVLIHLMTCTQRGMWSITMVQLIALTYKDQHVGTLQKLLNLWFEASLSESSEDNESNTSPPDQGSGDSSPMLTSDPTSDSSDNSSASTNKSNNMEVGCNNKQHCQRMHTDHIKNPNKMAAEIACKAQPAGPAGSGAARGKGAGSKTQHKKDRQHGGDSEAQKQTAANQNSEQSSGSPSIASLSSSSSSGIGSRPSTSASATISQPSPGSSNSSGRPPSPVPSTSSSGASSASLQPATPNNNQTKPGVPGVATNPHVKRSCISSSEMSDCGYGTQVENQESVSTSSNEDDLPQKGMKPVHQKPHNPNKIRQQKPPTSLSNSDKKEWRRKKLVKRSRTNILNVKALMQHTPTDEDISHLLKEFTVDFLLKGYGPLVQELHLQLLSELGMPVDTSHFFWLVTYFLKFASQLELELENIGPVLSSRVVSYLTFEGVNLSEQLQLALMQQEMDLKPCLRRLHLVVTAIREFIQAVETYRKSNHLSPEDKEFLSQLQTEISTMGDLRNLFVLLLRQYNPSMQSKQYLQDLIATNHILLLFLENCCSKGSSFNMTEHIRQFSTPEMMLQYGRLLESFHENGKFVNDCVFTMMHHISGDMNQVGALFQPGILKTFSLIWEQDFEVCDDWSDLIEYVIHKFVNTPRRGHPMLPLSSVDPELKVEEVPPGLPQPPTLEQNLSRWTKEECDVLYWYYVQSAQSDDPVDNIRNMFVENGSSSKTRVAIIEQLYTQDIIPHAQYLDLLKQEAVGLQGQVNEGMDVVETSGSSTPSIVQVSSCNLESQEKQQQSSDNIVSLIALLTAESHASQIVWLQSVLLEMCYVKLHYKTLHSTLHSFTMEPVPYHYSLMRQSVPLVPWNLEQSTVLAYPPFVLLLHKLGFHLPGDVGKVFPRIPHFWTAEVLYATALKLGAINTCALKFDPQELNSSTCSASQLMSINEAEETSLPGPSMSTGIHTLPATSTVPFAPMPEGNANWMQLVTKAKRASREQSPSQDLDSSLSKMSISDDDTNTSASDENRNRKSPTESENQSNI